jgi:xylitol oxidase
MGVPGPWHERLPHFRLDHVPSAGVELQSEYLIAREKAGAALEALLPLAPTLAPLIWVTEVRTIAADGHWLSPAFGRASAAIHFTWKPDWRAVRDVLPVIEERLRPFEPRPHWAKLFTMAPDELRSRYPGRGAFSELARSLDPAGKLRNEFLDAYVLDAG